MRGDCNIPRSAWKRSIGNVANRAAQGRRVNPLPHHRGNVQARDFDPPD